MQSTKLKPITQQEPNEINKKKRNPKEWLKRFLRYRKKGKSLTHKELDKIYEESYDD